jgi:hypothetical protein
MGTDKMRRAFHKPFMVRFPERRDWETGSIPIKNGGVIWYTDGSKGIEGTGDAVYNHGMSQKFSFSLGQHNTVFLSHISLCY